MYFNLPIIKDCNVSPQSVQDVLDPVKMLTPQPQLFLSRANCYLKLAKPLLALSDANKV